MSFTFKLMLAATFAMSCVLVGFEVRDRYGDTPAPVGCFDKGDVWVCEEPSP